LRECLGQFQPARVGHRQLGRGQLGRAGEPDPVERGQGGLAGRAHRMPYPLPPAEHRGHRDVVQHGHAAERFDDLEGTGDPGVRHPPRFGSGQVLPGDLDPTRGRSQVPGQEVDGGRFAGAVGADDAEQAPRVQADVQRLDGL
jgi:hypothetical protein